MSLSKRKLFESEIAKLLQSENIKFERQRKIPEKSVRVNFFIYSEIPTIIQIIPLSKIYLFYKSLLVSRFISLKMINGGNVRLVAIFYWQDSRLLLNKEKIQEKIIENPILKQIADEIILLDLTDTTDIDFTLSLQDKKKILNSLNARIKIHQTLKKVCKIEDFKVSFDRIDFVVKNLDKFSGFYSLMQSFFYNFFDKDLKLFLKENFIHIWRKWIEKEKFKRLGETLEDPLSVFRRSFEVDGWNFNDLELQAIIFKFKNRLKKSLKRKKNFRIQFFKAFNDDFLRQVEIVEKRFEIYKEKYNEVLKDNNYLNLRKNFEIYLFNYCLNYSQFKNYLPLDNIFVEKIEFRNYSMIKIGDKFYVIKLNNLNNFRETVFSIGIFGKYLKGVLKNDIELIIFLSYYGLNKYLNDNDYIKRKVILLEKNGWKTFPFQNFDKNVYILDKIFFGGFAEENE